MSSGLIFTKYLIFRGNDGAQLVGVANPWLIQLEVDTTTGKPCATLPEWPGTKDWDLE